MSDENICEFDFVEQGWQTNGALEESKAMKIPGRERRWIILGADGRHVTLGRHSDPTEHEIENAEQALLEKGLTGWVAVMEGDYYNHRRQPCIMMVRPLAEPAIDFDQAVAAFEAARLIVAGKSNT